MSAIIDKDGALGPDGIRRYHTTCKVIIHSHVNGTHIISQDVTSINVEKNIKGVGTATVTLVGSMNYLNIIHPNDYINLYFDIGDGEGWTRTFFGFVDIIREKYAVSESGEPTTQYVLKCSDFQKAFEKTQVYFNSWLTTRDDFTNHFGVTNIGGVALITAGITATGSPADVIRNIITLMFGFASQFVLPTGYGADSAVVSKNRNNRSEYLKGELGHMARSALLPQGSFEALKAKVDEETGKIAADIASLPAADAIKVLEKKHFLDADKLKNVDVNDASKVEELIGDLYYRRRFGAGRGSFNENDPSILQAIGAVEDLNRYSLLDVVDLFSLFEAESIDGWTVDVGIWESEGPLNQILKGLAHEEINEFYYDLRPVKSDDSGFNLTYSRLGDEINGNLGEGHRPDGISYVPHIVFREYPFGTVNTISGEHMHLSQAETTGLETVFTPGVFEVGALFSDKPNVPGRHTIIVPSQSLKQNVVFGAKATERHLDVAVIHSSEIVASDLARSDSDHFNLYEVYPNDFHQMNIKYMMSDVLPICTPLQVMRHGLRVRRYSTKYARYNIDTVGRVEGTNSANNSAFFKELVAGGTAQLTDEDLAEFSSVPPEPPSVDGLDSTAAVSVSVGTAFTPVEETGGNVGKVVSAYGYRTKVGGRVVQSQTDVAASGGTWVFHNGVDIGGPVGTPVRAVMDGVVVASVPNGVFGGYGATVIIKHQVPGHGTLYSLYAHLDTRTVGSQNVTFGPPGLVTGMAKDLMAGGLFPAVQVSAGDQIGTIGKSNGARGVPTTFTVGAHLHFEWIRKWEGRVYPSQSKDDTPDVDIPAGSALPLVRPAGDNPRSLNPIDIQGIIGAPLNSIGGVLPEDEQIHDAEAGMDGDDPSVAPSGNPTAGAGDALGDEQAEGANDGDSSAKKVGVTTIERQILRWGLLQDHWYQHNLEYLSGQIVMRGAPEIRAGYRLDLVDRRMSFYVDGVSHSWQFPEEMHTILTVSRGQSNNPFPMYVMPAVPGYNAKEQRNNNTRLGYFQLISDPISVQRAIVFRNTAEGQQYVVSDQRAYAPIINGEPFNAHDAVSVSFDKMPATGSFQRPSAGAGTPVQDGFYNDFVLEAETNESGPSAVDLDTWMKDFFSVDINTALDRVTGLDLEGPLKK